MCLSLAPKRNSEIINYFKKKLRFYEITLIETHSYICKFLYYGNNIVQHWYLFTINPKIEIDYSNWILPKVQCLIKKINFCILYVIFMFK